MANFWKIVNDVIRNSDILLMVLDARLVEQTRNAEIEAKIEREGKCLIYVLNKADLVSKEHLEDSKKRFKHCVFMSAKLHHGTNVLRTQIMSLSKGESVVVGVLGYPNTGKSSVINAMSHGGAGVSPVSGFTKGVQAIRASGKIKMLDTPGVLPFEENDEVKHLLISSMDPHRAKDPDIAAERLLAMNKNNVEKWYGVGVGSGLEEIALKLNFVSKGGGPDLRRAAIKVLMDWQRGTVK